MTPIQQFRTNIKSADHFLDMYKELRELKQLGARGALDLKNKYLLWLPRAAIVSSLSSLDAYVHQKLYQRIPQILKSRNEEVSDELAGLLQRVAPMKKTEDVRNALSYVRGTDWTTALGEQIRTRILQFESFQAPKKLVYAFKVVSIDNVLYKVADTWPGPSTTRDMVASRLQKYVDRRHQIAHEGDLDRQHAPRAITPKYATSCRQFVDNLVERLERVS